MKSNIAVLLPLFLALLCASSPAQDNTANFAPGTIRVTTTLHNDGTKTVMKTDPDSHTAEASTYNQANKLQIRVVFNLDDQGQPTGGSTYSPKGVLLCKMRYLRDGTNRVNEVDTYSTTNVLLTRQIYHFDAANRVTKIDSYDGNGNPINSTPAPARRSGSGQNH